MSDGSGMPMDMESWYGTEADVRARQQEAADRTIAEQGETISRLREENERLKGERQGAASDAIAATACVSRLLLALRVSRDPANRAYTLDDTDAGVEAVERLHARLDEALAYREHYADHEIVRLSSRLAKCERNHTERSKREREYKAAMDDADRMLDALRARLAEATSRCAALEKAAREVDDSWDGEPEVYGDGAGDRTVACVDYEAMRDLHELLSCPAPEGEGEYVSATEGRFELREKNGRRFWYGSEDGWKDATEIGENGTLTLSADSFEVGTVLTFSEPWNEADSAPEGEKEGES